VSQVARDGPHPTDEHLLEAGDRQDPNRHSSGAQRARGPPAGDRRRDHNVRGDIFVPTFATGATSPGMNQYKSANSQELRDALDNIYDARIPKMWKDRSWESATLGFWFTELLERTQQFSNWLMIGRPAKFWMTGFFNPQGDDR